ncbi:MAG TPA: hypothetical protein VEC38_14265 [Candidatus Binataceae bacterium]|nr:hypothetical protein [Candidatus Binataceae bacterium]
MKTKHATNPRTAGSDVWCQTVWQSFCADEHLKQIHKITDAEMKALSKVAMLGRVLSKQDYLFILDLIRRSPKRTTPKE